MTYWPPIGHIWLKTKPGSYHKVCERYRLFAETVMAHNNDLHDVVIIGDASRNVIEGFGIWEHAAHASNLEDGQDFAAFIADVTDDLAEPLNRNDLELLYRMNAGT